MEMLTGAVMPGDDVEVTVENDALVMTPKARPAA
jgi:antitoxin component of MazEF toxin-antitoxin module